jgi:hypothetical protein
MPNKPPRAKVQNIIKSLLDSEIPEIQSVAKRLADQIKELEEHSWRLQDYVTQIENLATEEASALVESRITDILQDLDKALGELKKRSKKAVVPRTEAMPAAPAPLEAEQMIEGEEEVVELKETEEDSALPRTQTKPPAYTTPEGYVIKKSRL